MATVTLKLKDRPDGTLSVTLESNPSFNVKDESQNTFAQRAGATALSDLMKRLNPSEDEEGEPEFDDETEEEE